MNPFQRIYFLSAFALSAFLSASSCAPGEPPATPTAINVVGGRRLVQLALAPTSLSLQTGAQRLFTVTAQWSDNTNTLPPLQWSTRFGGTVTQTGIYTAPTFAVVDRLVVKDGNSSLADSVSIAVTTPSAPVPPSNPPPSPPPPPPPSPPGAMRMNEPPGFVTITDNAMSATPAPGALISPTTGVTGRTWYLFNSGADFLVADTNSNAPVSPPRVYRFKFAAGLPAGNQPGGQVGFTTASTAIDYKSWYESGAFRVGVFDFETQLVGVKVLGYWGVGNPSTSVTRPATEFIGFLPGNGTSTAALNQWKIAFSQQSPGPIVSGRRLDMNQNTNKRIFAGQWHQYEMLATVNTIGQANGTFKFWLDGTLVCDYSDIVWITSANPGRFYGRKIDPIWGGLGGTPKTRDDFVWWDHIYVSGVP